MRKAFRLLADKPERKRPFRIPTCRWEDNIQLDLKQIRWQDASYIKLL
jgi:hypothetical protein